ncbi:MAG: helix-turn-helix domain-containing protein [Pseudobdellovibrio sp.]
MYLKKRRIAATCTQAELANQLKVHVQFVSDWERGLYAPPDHCFQQALDILKVDRRKVVDVMVADSKREIKNKFLKRS